ncbi:type VI secretion system membrane subunit TssM [Salmonella enterica]|nr:type VI secretion system membrane subunit TssM [Salmonella enterica]EEJ9112164.1 type VI secretion system membrane subunit TssM [Salmonella enterica subsp. enterica serovar Newport]EAO6293530.1 type VI secretion system membrane subunit TssM [Salmonella enterica]EBO9635281.1 type VI secretion system membrane subunit TssM [Salmonella enterica]EEH0356294.1 type VI secretion system membrane subunit TssM [Salmonella enterica]
MSIIGISVLCLAIGFVTPLLALGDVHPFAPLWVRLTLIGFILLMYALYGLYRLWRALRMDEQLLRRFLHPRGEEVPVAGEIKADLRTVNHIVTQAIRQLRQLRVDMPVWRKIFEGKRFLYELPWFMVVGSPGDGKTTALLNTGLQFPLAEQMEQTSRILTVPGGGTLHCDWWFTNEAVLIDTAGRYARHDDGGEVSAAQRNAGEWQGFLGLLRKHRPGAPLNGVILTLNVADLTAQSPAERLAACAALRARLAELRETLGIRFPVYLVVTKMDLLPGFSEYFRTLTSHLRAQIWGFTLPYSRRRKAGDPQALHAACAQELARLTLRLDQGLDTRLQEEYDLKSRQRLYTFPREFAALGEPLLEAIEQIFLDSKFDATQLNNTLRGVFFTSAAQAQADAVADQLSIWQRFVRAIKTARGESSASLPHALPDGNRSYFLHDLLTQFIFREAHLVEPNLQWAWRYRLLRLGGHLLVLVLAFLLWQGMQTSQQTNGDYLNEISARATRLDGDVKAYTGKPAMAPVPALLDSARELSAWPELDPDAPPLTWRYGLYSVPPVTAVTLTPTEAGQQQHRMQADTVRFEYDRSGWLTAEHAGNGSIRYQRDALGNPTDITLPDGQHLTHLYYGSGHLLQTALDGLTVSEYERDSLHRQIMRTQGQLATYSGYDDDGLLSWQRSLASGSAPVLPGQRPARQGCVTSRDYYWNNHGEVGTIDDGLRGSVVYSYDRSGYLTGRSGQMYDHDRYYYDKAGNLLDNEGQGAVMNNRLPGCGRDRYGYNEWGELTTRRDQQLEWNAQGQLTRVISGNTETHYGYDALGRRIRKATYGRHTGHTARSRTDFVWEGVRLLQENVQQQGWRTYLYDAEQPYTPVASVTGKGESRQVWYYHTDVTGTPQEVTAADGTLVWAGYIRGFGENAADISNSGAYFHQPLRLPGQYFDDETGLHYNLFRYYAPECGRFVSQDPIGLKGGLNLYAYAPNPIRWIDPLGLAILEHQSNFDAARRTGFENAGMTNPEDVTFSKVDPKTGTVVEFKGPNGAKVAYDAPHADMDVTAGHDKPHVGWQSAGKRGSGGANRGNITYDGPQHPHRSDSKGDDKC